MAIFLKNVTFHGILLDMLFEEAAAEWREVAALLQAGIRDGVVRPLKCTVFPRTRVEDAFRHMAQGKHIGKVVVKVRGALGAPWRWAPRAVREPGSVHCRCVRRSGGPCCSGPLPS